MKSEDLIVRCLLRCEGEHWVAICIDFDLAAQGATLREAKERLAEQIDDYVGEALSVDRKHAAYLLRRKAPLRYRVLYHWLGLVDRWNHARTRGKAYLQPLPLVPMSA